MTILAYSSVFSAGFIWDDDDHVISIVRLSGLNGLARIWTEPGATMEYYPLLFSAFWAQIQLWGLNPLGFHLVNILLHTCNALLLWHCLKRLEIPGSFWAACIFALHPLHVESVAWVTELKNVLSAFFYLLSFSSYWRFSELFAGRANNRKMVWLKYSTALLLFAMALLSKTVTCTLPPAILVLCWWKRGRIARRDIAPLIPFFAMAFILGKFTIKIETDYLLAKGPEWDFSWIERILIAGRVIWFHAGKLLWPHPIMFNYPRWHLDAGEWWQYLFPLTAIAMLILLWHFRDRTGRGMLAACLFVMGTNFPVLGFLNVYSMRFSFVADHYYYIANIGVIVLFCTVIGLLQQKLPSFKNAEKIFFGVILLILSVMTWQQGKTYHDKLTLFNDIVNKNPASWFGYSNRAAYYGAAGMDDLAMADLDKSLAIKPDEADALHMRGILYLKKKKYDRAFSDFDQSIAIRPWRTDYIKNRSQAYRVTGQLDKALDDVNKVLKLEADATENFLLRASIYLLLENYPAAISDLNNALALDPEEADAWANRGLVYLLQGLTREAIADFNQAIVLRPDTAATYYNRGLANAEEGAIVAAKSDFAKATQLGYPVSDSEVRHLLSNKASK